jgi:hypothetical protein
VSDAASCDTSLARVTFQCEAGGGILRLAIASKKETLPEPQAQPNSIAANVALQNRKSEDWIAALERADIRLRGSSTELRCSIVIDDTAIQAEERSAFLEIASNIVTTALRSQFGVELSKPEMG